MALFVLFAVLLFTGCKKEEEFNIRYEVTTTAPMAAGGGIVTKLGRRNGENHGVPAGESNWSKEVFTDTDYRPFDISLNAQNLQLNAAGSVTVRIFINGEQKAIGTTTTTDYGDNQHIANTAPVQITID